MARSRSILAFTLCLLLAACSNPGPAAGSSAPASARGTDSPETAPASASAASPSMPTPAPGPTKDPDARECYIVESNQRKGVVDGRGAVVLPIRFSKIDELYAAQAVAAFFAVPAEVHERASDGRRPEELGELYGADGRKLAEGLFRYAYAFNDRLIQACRRDGEGRLRFGVLENTGKTVVPFVYDDVQWMDECLVGVKGESERITKDIDIYDMQGVLLRSGAVNLRFSSGGYLEVCDDAGSRYGMMDTNFRIVVPAVWDDVRECLDGRFIVRSGKMVGVIDRNGRQVIPMEYDEVNETLDGANGDRQLFTAVAKDGVSLLDAQGNVLFHSALYRQIQYSGGVITAVDEKNLCHALDMSGRELLPPAGYIYWMAEDGLFVCNYADNRSDSYFTKDGVKLPLPEADFTNRLTGDRFLFGHDEPEGQRIGICDRQGNVVVQPQYDYLYRDAGEDRLVYGIKGKDGKLLYGLMDLDGRILLPPVYAALYGRRDRSLLRAEYGIFSGLIDTQGNWVWHTTVYDALVD